MNLRVIVLGHNDPLRREVQAFLTRSGVAAAECGLSITAVENLLQRGVRSIVMTAAAPFGSASSDAVLAMARQIRAYHPLAPIVFVAAQGSEDMAVSAFKAGANDYLRQPLACKA